MEYASKGVAGAGLGTGIAGLSLGVLNAMGGTGLLNGLFGGCNGRNCNGVADAAVIAALASGRNGYCAEDTAVTRGEMRLTQENATLKSEIAQRDAYIYTDQQIDMKLGKVIERAENRYEALAAEVRGNKDAQTAINMQQAVYNGTNTATIGCLQNQVAELLALTRRVVPNRSVCPGWGDVTITPATPAEAAASAAAAG